MFANMLAFLAGLILIAAPAEARRVALVIGQSSYPGGASATIGLPALDNPVGDARRMTEILTLHGFEVISCEGKTPGCLDLDRTRLLEALNKLEQRAEGADLALVFFAGHGAATDEGNILAPIDARVNCDTGAVTKGVLVEHVMAATEPARMKLVILDACRDNPLSEICPSLKGKKPSFTRIEAGATQGLLLVTSTQFGQQALDGLAGTHSPFATALFAAFEANPGIYFEQVFNEVARATWEAAQKQGGFLQIPGKVVGGVAPADCLAGEGCVGDARMAALAIDNERLTKDASGVRNILEREEKTRGKPYTAEERQKRVAELEATLVRIGTSTDPLEQEARRLMDQGNVAAGQAKLDEALDADEQAAAEANRLEAERRKAGAQKARNLAVLARGTNVIKAVSYYQRATRLDSGDAQVWDDYARAALDAGRTDEAKAAFEQAALKAQDSNNLRLRYWAKLGLGDVADVQGSLPAARRFYDAALAMAKPIAEADPRNAQWQRDLSVSHNKVGDVRRAQGNLSSALESYRASLAIVDRLAKAEPGSPEWQRDLSVSHNKIGGVLRAQGNLPAALESYRASYAVSERLAKAAPENPEAQRDVAVAHNFLGNVYLDQGKLAEALDEYRGYNQILSRLATADPGNSGWQRDLGVSHNKIGDVLVEQGDLPAALESYWASLAIRDRLAKGDAGNAEWQRDLGVSQSKVGDVRRAQGNLSLALESYRTSHAIVERLAKADPGNAGWQRDLSVSDIKIGEVLVEQGNLTGALESFRASHAIRERLVTADPRNAGWQRDLSVSHDKIGDVLRAQGNLPAALESYSANLAIAERLAKANPGNAGWQRHLALSYGRVAMVFAQQGKRAQALTAFHKGRDIITKLKAAAPSSATLSKDLVWFGGQISALETR